MATGCDDGWLRIVDAASGVVEQEVCHGSKGHGSEVRSVAWSPSGAKVMTGCCDGQLRTVDAASGVVERQMSHGHYIMCGAWSP